MKNKLQQKCTALQNEETFLIRSFKFFDFKNSGEVDFPTFQKAIAKIGVLADDNDLWQYFQAYDSNGSNTIDYKEFTNIVFGKSAVVPASLVTQSQFASGQTPKASLNAGEMSYRGIRE